MYNLEKGMKIIVEFFEKVNVVQIFYQVIQILEEFNDFVSKFRFGLMEVVYEWVKGVSFKNIMNLMDVLEGMIVWMIFWLDEMCREVKNVVRIIGDFELYQKMMVVQELIRRDIIVVVSFYM